MHHPAFIIIIKISDQSVRANVFLSTTPLLYFCIPPFFSIFISHFCCSYLPASLCAPFMSVRVRCPEFVALNSFLYMRVSFYNVLHDFFCLLSFFFNFQCHRWFLYFVSPPLIWSIFTLFVLLIAHLASPSAASLVFFLSHSFSI